MSAPAKDQPPSFCILRTKKLRTMGNIAGSAGHTFRELDTPNADPARTHLNVTIGARSSAALCYAVKERLPAKRRKDAVLCIEYLITASPEWFNQASNKTQNEYFKGATKWLEDVHGKENVVCLNMQNDEASPHLVAYVVPRTKDGRLSAKDFLGGRAKLSKMQTDFYKAVAAPVGLQRGVEGSKAHHTTAKQYNAALTKNPTLRPPEPPAPTWQDRITGKAKEMEAEHEAEQARYAAQVEQARNVALVAKKSREAQMRAIAAAREEVEELRPLKDDKARLEAENKALTVKLASERKYFLGVIDDLKAKLKQATEKVVELMREVGLLKKKVASAEDEAYGLRQKLSAKTLFNRLKGERP